MQIQVDSLLYKFLHWQLVEKASGGLLARRLVCCYLLTQCG